MSIPRKAIVGVSIAALLLTGAATATAQSANLFRGSSSSAADTPLPSQPPQSSTTSPSTSTSTPADPDDEETVDPSPTPTGPGEGESVDDKRVALKESMLSYYEREGHIIDEWLNYMAQLIADGLVAGEDMDNFIDKGVFTFINYSNDELGSIIEQFDRGETDIITRYGTLGIGVAGGESHTFVVIYWA